MRKFTLLFISLLLASAVSFGQENCVAGEQLPIQLMQQELRRGWKTYQKQKPPVYYLSYTYTPSSEITLEASANGLKTNYRGGMRIGEVSVRVGSPAMDNTRVLKNTGAESVNFVETFLLPEPRPNHSLGFRRAFWEATKIMIERAQTDFHRVQADTQTSSSRQDNSDDFVFPPKSNFCHMEPVVTVDVARIKSLLLRLSNEVRGHQEVLDSSVDFSFIQGTRYFVDSVGTELVTPILRMRLSYYFYGKMLDGQELSRGKTYDVLTEQELPDEDTIRADMQQSLKELNELIHGAEAEPVTVPAILKNRATAVFIHEVLGHRMEGHRQKQDSFGKTFTGKIGQLVTAPFITIVDDATLAFFKGEPLRGFYEYDDEGVKVRPVTLIENGVLREFLMSSSPIAGFAASNGHGRRSRGYSPVARMGVTRLIASQTVSYEELEQKLLEEIKRQRKPYGYVIDDLSGGFTMTETFFPQVFKLQPKYVYRLYPDGRKEVVRGADIVGTPLVSFSKILAAADDDAVFNGTCGAESGWVPVSSIAPSILLEALEVEKTEKSSRKPPILPAPISILKEDK